MHFSCLSLVTSGTGEQGGQCCPLPVRRMCPCQGQGHHGPMVSALLFGLRGPPVAAPLSSGHLWALCLARLHPGHCRCHQATAASSQPFTPDAWALQTSALCLFLFYFLIISGGKQSSFLFIHLGLFFKIKVTTISFLKAHRDSSTESAPALFSAPSPLGRAVSGPEF